MLVYFWPISIMFLTMLVLAILLPSYHLKTYFGRALPIILFTYLTPIVLLLAEWVLRYDHELHPNWVEPAAWRGYLMWGLVLVHALAISVIVVVLTGRRLRAIALVTPGLWLSLSTLLPVGCAIAGVCI